MTGQALADDSLAPAAGGFSIGDPAPLFDDETDSNDWLRLDLQPPLSETSPLRFSGPSLSDGDEEPFQICASDFRRSWTVGIDSSQANDDDTDSRHVVATNRSPRDRLAPDPFNFSAFASPSSNEMRIDCPPDRDRLAPTTDSLGVGLGTLICF